jgi:hypothetical protein
LIDGFYYIQAPLAGIWDYVTVGMKLEVENKDIEKDMNKKTYWVASVMEVKGIKRNK